MVCALTPRNIVIITGCIVLGVVLLSANYSSHPSSSSTMYNTQSQNVNTPGKPLLSTYRKHEPHDPTVQQTVDSHAEQHFPQAIVIGVRKGGTRALTNMLKSHPHITSPKGEVHFFDRDEIFRKGVNWYIKRMPYTTPDQISIEKSPSYFVTPEVPQRICNLSPSVKLLLIVRDPIERAISDYSQLFNPGRNTHNISFEDLVMDNNHVDSTVQVIKVSTYDIHMVRWLRYFPVHQIHVVNGDALIADPAPEIIKVEEFLGVSSFFQKDMFYFNHTKGFYCWKKITKSGHMYPNCLGSGKGRTHPDVSKETRELLKQYFTSHNEKFFELVKTRFYW